MIIMGWINHLGEMKKFSQVDFIILPNDHPIFSSYFDMPEGLPKIHDMIINRLKLSFI